MAKSGLTLKDIAAGNKRLAEREGGPERISYMEVRNIIANQGIGTKGAPSISKNIPNAISAPTQPADGVNNLSHEIKELKETTKKGITDPRKNNSVNANLVKVISELKLISKSIQKLNNVVGIESEDTDPPKKREKTGKAGGDAIRVEKIAEQIGQQPVFQSVGEKITQKKQGLKDFMSFKGIMSGMGLYNPESTGVIATAINKRHAGIEYAKQAAAVEGISPKDKKYKDYITQQRENFNKAESSKVELREIESHFNKFKEGGFSREQAGNIKHKSGVSMEEAYNAAVLRTAEYDIRLSLPQEKPTTPVKSGRSTVIPPKVVKTPKAKTSTSPVKSGRSTVIPTTQMVTSPPSTVVPATPKITDAPAMTEAVVTPSAGEAAAEHTRLVGEQTDLLKKIEENTRGGLDQKKDKKEGDSTGLGGLLGNFGASIFKSIKKMFGSIGKVIRSIFNPRALLRIITKFALPTMIIGSLINGIIDGFKAWQETGSISEALIKGVGGILEFLSFGLFDAGTIRSLVEGVSEFYTEYIEEPLKDFIGVVEDVFDTVKTFFNDAFDSVTNMLKNIGIPKLDFNILGKDVSIGPFYPFKDIGGTGLGEGTKESKTSNVVPTTAPATPAKVAAPTPKAADVVYATSAEAAAVERQQAQQPPVIVNAPQTNNMSQTTTVTPKPTPRNVESTQQTYSRAKYSY